MKIDIKKEFIKSIVIALKIDSNPFNVGIIDEYLNGIRPDQYKDFYSALFGSNHEYLNSLDRIKKVSIIFKEDIKDRLQQEAILLVKELSLINEKIKDVLNETGHNINDIDIETYSFDLLKKHKIKNTHKAIIKDLYGVLGIALSKNIASEITTTREIYKFLFEKHFGVKKTERNVLSIIYNEEVKQDEETINKKVLLLINKKLGR